MVRDPDRIPRIVEKLVRVWSHTPSWRLGQLVSNMKGLGPQDLFYVEDEELESALDRWIEVNSW